MREESGFIRFISYSREREKIPVSKEALSIGKYFLDNIFLNTEDDALFFRTLKKLIEKYQTMDTDYWHFAEKTPIPMQDYLKVVYDL